MLAPVFDASNVELCRTVRFAVPIGHHGDSLDSSPDVNSFASLPAMRGLGVYGELTVCVVGKPDRQTGYLLNISVIDALVRGQIVPLISRCLTERVAQQQQIDVEGLLNEIASVLSDQLHGRLSTVRWNLTPYYSISMSTHCPDKVLVRQSFEFAAAHRLHCGQLDAETNQRIFGKCNNASGHGHNYRVEVEVEKPLESPHAADFTLPQLERIVHETIIRRFDHKHLNVDTSEFSMMNPSVENITRVCYGLLQQPIADAGGALRQVTVWETEKTSCSYPAMT